MIVGGLAMFGFAASTATLALLRGGVDDRGLIMAIGTLAVMGIGMFGSGGFRWSLVCRL